MTILEPANLEPRTINRHPLEIFVITLICFGAFMLWSYQSMSAGFSAYDGSDETFVQLIVHELIMATLALAVLRYRGYPVEMLLPQRHWRFIAIGGMLWLLSWAVSVAPELLLGDANSYAAVTQGVFASTTVSLLTAIAVSFVNGIYEEVFLLGYLQRALTKLGIAAAIGVSMLVRALCHTYQGPLGMVGVCLFGLVLAIYYWKTGDLTSCMVAHVLADFNGLMPFV